MKIDFRKLAKEHLGNAKHALAGDTEACLRSAALELRMAMEALTYERAEMYEEELSAQDRETWQPRKVLGALLEIDPNADQTCSLAIGLEPSYGETPETMTSLGTETVLSLREIKKNYDALGSFLHIPTLKQLDKPAPQNSSKIKSRCEAISKSIEAVVNSPIRNIRIGHSTEMNCQDCGNGIRRLFNPGEEPREVHCSHCQASYLLSETDDGKVFWKPRTIDIPCPTDGCENLTSVWNKQFKPGTCWTCDSCGLPYIIAYGVTLDTEIQTDKDST